MSGFEYRGDHQKLKRTLGFLPTFGATVGLVVSGTAMFSVGNVGAIAGDWAWLAGLIGLVPMMCAAFAYGELTAMMPGGGMVSDYTLPAFGRFWSMFALLSGYVLLIACDGGTQLVMGGLSMESLVGVPQPIVTFAILIILFLINMFGVEFYGRSEAVLTIIMMVIYVVLGALGAAGAGEAGGADPSVGGSFGEMPAGGWAAIFGTIGTAVWFYIGFEFTCPLAEENRKPYRHIPWALIIGLLTIYACDTLFLVGATQYTPLDVMATSAIPHVDASVYMLGTAGGITMSVITILAAFTSANAEYAALPRMLYGLSREHLVPLIFGKIHPKYRTPVPGLIFTTCLMLIAVVYITVNGANVDLVLTFIMTACVAWMVTYTIALLDVLVLRKKYPDFPRLWKAPAVWVTMPIGIAGLVFTIYTLSDYWLNAIICDGVIAAYCIIWMKAKGIRLGEIIPLEDMVKDIRERSEYIEGWDEAVSAWLEKRADAVFS